MKNNTKNFSKLVKEIGQVSAQCLTPKQVIDDLIQLSCNLLTEDEFLAKAFPRAFFRQSAVIRQEMHQYKNDPKAWALMSELVFEYMKLIKESEPFEDVLGSLYGEHLGQVLGQFLTPRNVCNVVSIIAMGDSKPEDFSKIVRIGDPTGCGAGSMILAQLRVILGKHGKVALKNCEVLAVDLDPRMIRMTTSQICLSAAIHRIPLRMFQAFAKNVLSQYDEINHGKPDALFVFDMFSLNGFECEQHLGKEAA